MNKDKFIEKIKYFLPLIFTFLFVAGIIVASNIINNINKVRVEFTDIDVQKEFQTSIPTLNIIDPRFLVINSGRSTINPNGDLIITKNNLRVGNYTGFKILIPLNIKSDIINQPNSFFVPDFKARIIGGEDKRQGGGRDERLRADWRLLLKSEIGCVEENRIQGNGFCLRDIGIGGGEWMSFNMDSAGRKGILANSVRTANRRNYTIVLEVVPKFAPIMNNQIPDFSITIENIRPVLKN